MYRWVLSIFKAFFACWILFSSIAGISMMRDGLATKFPPLSWEFIKVVLGPFIGAGLAFAANNYVHEQRKVEEHKTATRAAAFAIRAIYDDFVNYRYAIRTQTAQLHDRFRHFPDSPAPVWAYAKPLISTFSAVGPPDLKTLQFLLSHPEGQAAFTMMQDLERSYKDLANAHALYIEAAEELQTKLDGLQSKSWKQDAVTIGPRITAKAQDSLLAVLLRIGDEQQYLETYAALSLAAAVQFKSKLLKGPPVVSDKLKAENLQPIPEHIAQFLV